MQSAIKTNTSRCMNHVEWLCCTWGALLCRMFLHPWLHHLCKICARPSKKWQLCNTCRQHKHRSCLKQMQPKKAGQPKVSILKTKNPRAKLIAAQNVLTHWTGSVAETKEIVSLLQIKLNSDPERIYSKIDKICIKHAISFSIQTSICPGYQ